MMGQEKALGAMDANSYADFFIHIYDHVMGCGSARLH